MTKNLEEAIAEIIEIRGSIASPWTIRLKDLARTLQFGICTQRNPDD
jgi:hypothetical protein